MMKVLKIVFALSFVVTATACNNNEDKADASGNFEADEVIVSAQQNGEILSFDVNEGDTLSYGEVVGYIDTSDLVLQKAQVQATLQSLHEKTTNPEPQIELVKKQLAVQQTQLAHLEKDQQRFQNLVKADAATQKQLDDINAQVEETKRQIAVTQQQINLYHSNIATQNRSILSEKAPLQKSIAQIEEQISKGQIVNPVKGTVLTKYAMQGEMATIGKPLYKIADIDTITLRAYITVTQLSQIKLGQQVKVLIDSGSKAYKEYTGTVSWISDKSEFTPKTIQTKDERANLVYAIKIRVKNDGYLKIGMYAEVRFAPTPKGS
jgi:HlyD family secretion protein